MNKNHTYNYLEQYLYEVRSKGRFSVTLSELKESFSISEKALHQNLYRLKAKNQIAQIRQGFYVIIPPEYSHRGVIPLYLYANELMKYLNREYYLGLFTAAVLHGAAHQQPMEYQIITKKPALRFIKNEKLGIYFFTKSKWGNDDIIEKKTDAGFVKVSSPELTALDLIYYNDKIGGINRLLPILDELAEEIKPSKLFKTAQRYNQTTTIQRLGFIFGEVLSFDEFTKQLKKVLKERNYFNIPLSITSKNKEGEIDKSWRIIKNIELEYES